ncbi:hypothetical protein NT6N_07310 [Oceaniferula spumae]|uniref:Right handed beta helix domain-containing protein n=1 Tax=Oceaniferula spumae TaxID=2979115 RepID=A0AAT9FI19_9BACT
MNLAKIKICLLSSSLALVPWMLEAKDYRIDSQRAFDAINEVTLEPGDAILLKRGQSFTGMLAPKGNGDENAVIRISTYGKGPRPKIHAQGKHIAGLMLKDPSYWEVSGLEITNTDGSDKDQGTLFGIYVLAQGEEKVYRHVYIGDCYIHDVNGKVAGKMRGGIHVHIKKLKKSIFDDLRITKNRIVNVGGVGIGNTSSSSKVEFLGDETQTEYLWTNVYVAGNHVDHTGRNNIIARCSKDAIYEHNVLANSSRYDTGHSIFCFKTDGIKIQYNEAYGNVGKGGKDRGGFDADYNCVNTYIQYNYSHDNMWFCGIMKKPNRNIVIRYNITQNEKQGLYFYGFDSSKAVKNVHIYNNTHYTKIGLKVAVFPEGRTPRNTLFENNIFYFEGEASWGKGADKAVNTRFNNNLYYGIAPHPSDSKAVTENPDFVSPGKAGIHVDWGTMNSLKGYRVRRQSPCRDQGVEIKNNGGIDFFKNKIKEKSSHIGAVVGGA